MVSIHALLAECDTPAVKLLMHFAGFNPRTPCGVRRAVYRNLSIKLRFQSTHSLRSATEVSCFYWGKAAVSIHALLAECDLLKARGGNIYAVSIHALLAECDSVRLQNRKANERFQSTHSLRSATSACGCGRQLRPVSIHALLAECDSNANSFRLPALKFQSTHSLRSATVFRRLTLGAVLVSIHALLAECD